MWEGAAEWSVLARNAAGQTLTDFEAISESSQPNYQGVNNEKQVLGRVFGEAFAEDGRRPAGCPAAEIGRPRKVTESAFGPPGSR